MQDHVDTTPWYRQFWPWFLIALPAAAVIGSIITVSLAVNTPDALVVDDYDKIGIATQRKLERDELAARLAVQAAPSLRRDAASATDVFVTLSGRMTEPPAALHLLLTHPTLAHLDVDTTLEWVGSGFAGTLPELSPGRYYVQITPVDGSWRLSGELDSHTRDLVLSSAGR